MNQPKPIFSPLPYQNWWVEKPTERVILVKSRRVNYPANYQQYVALAKALNK
jgi:hypothetical protein